ncbi:relaxase/mobilization nuclease domain-containing protein [Pedobacter sp. MW01-1-1]|uniref:relaxase/mobilization nuclease domain-containing protein n=1 Tax=Pedobacter sp. MW01-1-1 TaxID=3383027 RepID=UPI003FEFC96E
MIVKILAPSGSFAGVRYNHEKMQSGKGELLRVKNFGALMSTKKLGPQDFINYLKSVSAINKKVIKPQLHAVISAKGKGTSKYELMEVAEKWLIEMGYGQNPYLIIFHKDTQNNHVHIVSTRVDKNGFKISSAFEKIRAVKTLSAIRNKQIANESLLNQMLQYRFSTFAQIRTLLEDVGFELRMEKDAITVILSDGTSQKLKKDEFDNIGKGYVSDRKRARQLAAIFKKEISLLLKNNQTTPSQSISSKLDFFATQIHKRLGLKLVFHSSDGKAPYGYTIMDHATKSVLKGFEVMPIREILHDISSDNSDVTQAEEYRVSFAEPKVEVDYVLSKQNVPVNYDAPIPKINLKEDIDDEAFHGRNRQRKGKARTNTR